MIVPLLQARRSTRQSRDPAASHQQLINTSDDDHVGRDRLLSRDLRATKPVCVIRWGRFIVPPEVDEVTRDEIFLILGGIAFDG
ncbi:hypothetical protein LINPERHAP1_LOCUS940 [Linum perenne]